MSLAVVTAPLPRLRGSLRPATGCPTIESATSTAAAIAHQRKYQGFFAADLVATGCAAGSTGPGAAHVGLLRRREGSAGRVFSPGLAVPPAQLFAVRLIGKPSRRWRVCRHRTVPHDALTRLEVAASASH